MSFTLPHSTDNAPIRSVLSWLEQALSIVHGIYLKRHSIVQKNVPFIELQRDMQGLLALLRHQPDFRQFNVQHVWHIDAHLRAFAHWMGDARQFLRNAPDGIPDQALTDEMWMTLLATFDFTDVAQLRRRSRMHHGQAITAMTGRLQQCKMRAPDLALIRVDVGHQGDYSFAGVGQPDGQGQFVRRCNQLRSLIREEFSRSFVHDEVKLVYSSAKGLRARLLLAMDAQEVLSDERLGDAVCKLWLNQIGGDGAHAYNCNNTWFKALQIPCGIGFFPLASENFHEQVNPMMVSLAKPNAMFAAAYPTSKQPDTLYEAY